MNIAHLAATVCLAATIAAQVPPPRFQSGVELIEVSVLARDAAGRPVTDLRQDEIIILDRGVPQKVLIFERISLPIPPVPATAVMREARDVSTNERTGESRVFMLVLDALHVAGLNVATVRRHAREFVERHVGPNDYAAVFSPGGLAAATEDFTTDKARLLAAIDRFNASKLASAAVERDKARRNRPTAARTQTTSNARAARALAEARALAVNVEERTAGRRCCCSAKDPTTTSTT
jgi:VWFA-related protein